MDIIRLDDKIFKCHAMLPNIFLKVSYINSKINIVFLWFFCHFEDLLPSAYNLHIYIICKVVSNKVLSMD